MTLLLFAESPRSKVALLPLPFADPRIHHDRVQIRRAPKIRLIKDTGATDRNHVECVLKLRCSCAAVRIVDIQHIAVNRVCNLFSFCESECFALMRANSFPNLRKRRFHRCNPISYDTLKSCIAKSSAQPHSQQEHSASRSSLCLLPALSFLPRSRRVMERGRSF